MDKIEKHIKEKLDVPIEFPPNMEMWQGISQKLDEKSRRSFVPLWIALSGLIIAASLFFFQKWNKPQINQIGGRLTDTIYLTNTIVKYDTVYVEKIVERVVFQNRISTSNENRFNTLQQQSFVNSLNTVNDVVANSYPAINDGQSSKEYMPTSLLKANTDKEKFKDTETQRQRAERMILSMEYLSPQSPSLLAIEQKGMNPYFPFMAISKRKKGIGEILKPKAYYVGMGLALSQITDKEKLFLPGSNLNLELKIAFSRKLYFWTDLSLSRDHLQSPNMNPDDGVPFVTSPAEGYQFNRAEAFVNGMNLDFGLKYILWTQGRFQPWLGLGYGIRKEFDYELNYDFIHPITGGELSIDRVIPHDVSSNQLLHLKFGTLYRINRRFSIEPSITFRKKTGNSNLLVNEVFMPKIQLFYRMK